MIILRKGKIMKIKYETPCIKIVIFDTIDIITASGDDGYDIDAGLLDL